MKKTIPFVAAILFFTSCNHTAQPKPDADRVIKDTLARSLPPLFNQSPNSPDIYAKVEPKQDKFLSPRDAGIKQMMEGLKAEPQKFVIDNKQVTEITGERGTKLSFKPNCFISKEGNEVSDPVTIELKECYTVDAMLRENLLTATDGGFSASKGMVCVNAYASGQTLQLKVGETIDVQLPFAPNVHHGYRLYHGNENADGLVAWNSVSEVNAPAPKVFPTADFLKPDFSYFGLGLKEYLLQTLNYPDEARRNELSAKVEVTFTINGDGKVTDVTTAESYKIFRQAIEQSFKNMPSWKAAVYNGKNIASSVHVNIDFNIRRAEQVQIDFNEAKASLISSGTNIYVLYGCDLKGEVAQGLSAQSLGQMGWFNYGKELKPGKEKGEVIVCSNEKTEVKLLMKKGVTIIGGENCLGYADFKNLPLGEEAYVVAVRYEGGRMYYAVQPVTLNKQTIISLKWKKGDKEEIAKVYNKLSKGLS